MGTGRNTECHEFKSKGIMKTAYSAILREYDTLWNVKQELDEMKFEKNSVGDRLKIELLKKIKEGDKLFKDTEVFEE